MYYTYTSHAATIVFGLLFFLRGQSSGMNHGANDRLTGLQLAILQQQG